LLLLSTTPLALGWCWSAEFPVISAPSDNSRKKKALKASDQTIIQTSFQTPIENQCIACYNDYRQYNQRVKGATKWTIN